MVRAVTRTHTPPTCRRWAGVCSSSPPATARTTVDRRPSRCITSRRGRSSGRPCASCATADAPGRRPLDALGWGRRAAARAVALAKVRGADVVLSSAPSHLATLAGWYAMRRLDLPWVAELHDDAAGESPSRGPRSWVSYARLTDAALRQATTLVTAGATVQSLRNRYAGIAVSEIDRAEGGVAAEAMDVVLRESMRRSVDGAEGAAGGPQPQPVSHRRLATPTVDEPLSPATRGPGTLDRGGRRSSSRAAYVPSSLYSRWGRLATSWSDAIGCR